MITVTLGNQPWIARQFCQKDPGGPQIPEGIAVVCSAPGHIHCEKGIFVASRAEELPGSHQCKQCAAVLNSANAGLLELASKLRIPTLTCGMSGADTFTVSSWRADGGAISLLRPLTALDGHRVEPFELPVYFVDHRPEVFELLACSAVFCLLGEDNPLNGLERWNL